MTYPPFEPAGEPNSEGSSVCKPSAWPDRRSQRELPIAARIGRVWVMTGTAAPGRWRTMAELPLATA
jgi:hypothetical protein